MPTRRIAMEELLYAAARGGRRDELVALLDGGAPPDCRLSEAGLTPLHVAAANNQPRCVGALLERGARADLTSSAGLTALAVACERGHAEVVELLVSSGASPTAGSRAPVLFAASLAEAACLRRLLHAKADPNTADGSGACALHVAASANRPKCIQELLAGCARLGTPAARRTLPPAPPHLTDPMAP